MCLVRGATSSGIKGRPTTLLFRNHSVMAHTDKTCHRLQDLGVCDAHEARAMVSRAESKCTTIDLGAVAGATEDDAILFARWRYNVAVRGEIRLHRSRCQSPPPPSLSGDDEEFFRAQQYEKHLPACPDCKGKNLEPAALQTRSADEGPSIYMKCISCNKIVRPKYVK